MWEGPDHRNQGWALLSQRDNGGFPFTSNLWLVTETVALEEPFVVREVTGDFSRRFLNILSLPSPLLEEDAQSHWKEKAAAA